MEPEIVARLARELNGEQRRMVHDMIRRTWRLAGLAALANAKELIAEGQGDASAILSSYEERWKRDTPRN
jgi:hypothetical protein